MTTGIEATDSLVLAVAVSALVGKLKSSANPALSWISEHRPWMVRTVAALGAAVAAAGMTWDYQTAGGVLTITGLTVTSAASFLWLVVKQFALQEGYFRVTKTSSATSAVR